MDASKFESSDFGTVVEDDGGYNWFDPAPIPRGLQLDTQTQMALSRADEALGGLAAISGLLSKPELLWRPYAYREALASARIEGTQADLKSVLEADRRRANVYEDLDSVVSYFSALEDGRHWVEQGELPTFELLVRVHDVLTQAKDSELHGRRKLPVWLGSPTDRPETAVFVPPLGLNVDLALHDWDGYVEHPPAVPVLVRAALLHYQFLTIHPFVDGNGRVGRIFVLLFLAAEGRLPHPMLYLSSYFERERRQYFDRLQAVRERGEIQEWIQFFLTAVERQAKDGIRRAGELIRLREHYRKELATSSDRGPALVDLMFENPFLTTATVTAGLGLSKQGALNILRGFENRNWLQQVARHGRGGARGWVAPEILGLLVDEPA